MPEEPKKKKRRKLDHEHVYLENLPNADMYEKSYMHRDEVTQVIFQIITYLMTLKGNHRQEDAMI